ncbi:hypothetical protein VAWG001_00790 [Aeromonas dhakensis]|nr:hypothetical protein VAWG001_00790 [Aeromonas dhakensis]
MDAIRRTGNADRGKGEGPRLLSQQRGMPDVPPILGGVTHMVGWSRKKTALGWLSPKEGLEGSKPPDKATLNE